MAPHRIHMGGMRGLASRHPSTLRESLLYQICFRSRIPSGNVLAKSQRGRPGLRLVSTAEPKQSCDVPLHEHLALHAIAVSMHRTNVIFTTTSRTSMPSQGHINCGSQATVRVLQVPPQLAIEACQDTFRVPPSLAMRNNRDSVISRSKRQLHPRQFCSSNTASLHPRPNASEQLATLIGFQPALSCSS